MPPRMGRGRRFFWWLHSKCFRRHPAGYAECRFCRRELGNQLGHPLTCPLRLMGWIGWRLRYCPSWGGADAPFWEEEYR